MANYGEMLDDYDVLMYSVSGSSNGIIARQFYQGLDQNPDAVVLGFTDPSRIEFHDSTGWFSYPNVNRTSSEQRLLADLYKVHVPKEMSIIKDSSLVRGLLSVLEQKKIPYAWTLNLLFNNLAQTPFPSDPWINKVLGDFFYRMTSTNLATYQEWKASPGFHTDDPIWQQKFAQEVQTLLKSFDFLSSIK